MSDSPHLPTGYGRLTREILTRIGNGYKQGVTCLGWFDEACPARERTPLPFSVYSGRQDYGKEEVSLMVTKLQPNVVVGAGDIWMLQALGSDQAKPFPRIAYVPIDSRPIPNSYGVDIGRLGKLVVPSLFGENAVKEEFEVAPVVVPYGVNTALFHPIPDTLSLRDRLCFGDTFIVGTVSRNHFRKNLPCLVKAFARFAEGKKGVALYIHTPIIDQGGIVTDLLDRYKLGGKAFLTRDLQTWRGVDDETLNQIYNLFDVFVLPTMGEGFGLPILEAMACGVPVIATDCSAVTELVQGRGELIRVKEWLTVPPYNVDMAIADVDHLVELLEKLYNDPDLRAEYGRKGREFAEKMTWDRCAEQWAQLLDEVVGDGEIRHRRSTFLHGRDVSEIMGSFTVPLLLSHSAGSNPCW